LCKQESYRDPDTGCADAFLDSLFWSVDSSSSGSSDSSVSTAAEQTAAATDATQQTDAGTESSGKPLERPLEQPLGTQLVHAVMQLLFLGGFTVEPNDYGGPAESDVGKCFQYISICC
jgi:High-temperature-induced dauer-formation protein